MKQIETAPSLRSCKRAVFLNTVVEDHALCWSNAQNSVKKRASCQERGVWRRGVGSRKP